MEILKFWQEKQKSHRGYLKEHARYIVAPTEHIWKRLTIRGGNMRKNRKKTYRTLFCFILWAINVQASIEFKRKPASNHPRCVPKLAKASDGTSVACPSGYTNESMREYWVPNQVTVSKGAWNCKENRQIREGSSRKSSTSTTSVQFPSGAFRNACQIYCCSY